MTRLLETVAALSGVLILLVLLSVRRAHIRVEYSVSWLVAGVFMMALAFSPGMLSWLSHALGLNDPPAALNFLLSGISLLLFYRFSIIISRLRDDNIALAQRLAIIEFELKSLEKKGIQN